MLPHLYVTGTESEVTLFTQGSYLVTCSVGTPHYNSALEPRSWAAVLCFSISTKHTGHKWLCLPHPILCFMAQAVRDVLLHDGPLLVSAASQWSVLPGVSWVLTNIEGCWCCWGGRCMSWQPRAPRGLHIFRWLMLGLGDEPENQQKRHTYRWQQETQECAEENVDKVSQSPGAVWESQKWWTRGKKPLGCKTFA